MSLKLVNVRLKIWLERKLQVTLQVNITTLIRFALVFSESSVIPIRPPRERPFTRMRLIMRYLL